MRNKSKYLLDEKPIIDVNGEKYYLRIRTNDTKKPVVLFLHGGPGSPDRPQILRYLSSLADDCVMVCWDQRGSGLAYSSKRAKTEVLTRELYIGDALNVINYLRERFKKDKIILVGHSFGSQYALWVLEKYPELVGVYAGIGQFIDSVKNEDIAFKFTMNEAIARKDKRAIKKLNSCGPPVDGIYKDNKFIIQRNYLHKFGGSLYGSDDTMIIEYLKLAPIYLKEYGFPEMIGYLKGVAYSLSSPLAQYRERFLETVKELKVPVCLLLGHHDYNCSFELGAKWLEQLKAPYKKLIWFENSAHSPQFEEPELWCEAFRKEVLEKFHDVL